MYIFPSIFVVLGIAAAVMYNSLVRKKNQVVNVFATVDAMLKKRYDLIPNLVAVAQQYMKHERHLLSEVTRLRAQAISGDISDDEKIGIDKQVSKAIKGIFFAVENYPDLKANQNFLHLQATMVELEEQVAAARRAYNAAVTDYNNGVEMFPTNLLAKAFGFRSRRLFEIESSERLVPDAHVLFQR
ncbi:MAG: LemA family protein [bacterium]